MRKETPGICVEGRQVSRDHIPCPGACIPLPLHSVALPRKLGQGTLPGGKHPPPSGCRPPGCPGVAAWHPHRWTVVLGSFLGFGQRASARRTVCGSEAAVSLEAS